MTFEKAAKTRKDSRTIVSLYVFLLILTPIVNVGIGMPLRLDDLFLIYLVIRMPINSLARPSFPNVIIIFFGLSCLLSFCVGLAAGQMFVLSRANDVLVILRLYLIICVVRYYANSVLKLQHILKWLFISICISCAIAAIQYFRVEPFSYFLTKIYSLGSDKYLPMLEGTASFRRAIGSYKNPNYAGLFFAVGAVYGFHVFAQRQGYSIVHGLLSVTMIALSIITVSSRTSIAILFVCACVYIGMFFFITKQQFSNKVIMTVKIAFVSGLLVYVFFSLPEGMLPTRVYSLFDASGSVTRLQELTMHSRGENWERAMLAINNGNNWIVGNGPSPWIVIDSEYLYIIYTQGVIGICLVLVLWLWPVLTLPKLHLKFVQNIAVYLFAVLFVLPIFGVNAPVLFNVKSGPLCALLWGMWLILLDYEKMANLIKNKYKASNCTKGMFTKPRTEMASIG